MTTAADAADDAIARVFRQEAGALTASITRVLGDFAVAEEVVGDTLVIALEHWRRDGVPPHPAAWLMTTARRRALDALRRDRTYRRKLSELAVEDGADRPATDDRLRLIFTCCHPALGPEARVALTLQAVLGFTAADIASAFIVSESAVAQRLSRARRKIAATRIPYAVPADDELADRLTSVLDVLYLAFNEGYLSARPTASFRRDLAEDAAWLAAALAEALPDQPEVLGLLALMRLQLARSEARFDDAGHLVLLRRQDRARWDRLRIEAAVADLERAASMQRPGPFQVQAAIAACHAEAPAWDATDWVQVLILYDLLLVMLPTPVVRLNRAIALREVAGPDAALAEVDAISGELDTYHLLHATRAELLLEVGAPAAAREAETRALALARNPAERWILAERLDDDAAWVRRRS